MAPRPKPTKLKKLAGNPGKRKINAHEARVARSIPDCPKHLLGEARREWKRLSSLLFDAGLLSQIDRAALAAYCVAWGRWVKAEQELSKHGMVTHTIHGTLKQSPYVVVAKNAMEEVRKFAVEFGMTPSSRSKVSATDMEQMTLADLLFKKAASR